MPTWDEVVTATLKQYEQQLIDSIMKPNVLLQHISPEWQAEQARLDAIGPEHKPNWRTLCEVRMEQFKPRFRALMEEFGAEITSYEEIDIHIGSAWWNWSTDSYDDDDAS